MKFLMVILATLLVVISSPLTIVYAIHYTAKKIAKALTDDGDTNSLP